jgi:hypothetical protein
MRNPRRSVDVPVSSGAFQPGKFARFARSFPLRNGLPRELLRAQPQFLFVNDL